MYTVCICLCVASAFAQPGKSDASLYSLSGNVDSLHEVFYKAVYRNGKLEKGVRFHDEELYESSMVFDDAGYKTLEYRFGQRGDTLSRIVYHYDAFLNRAGLDTYKADGTARKARYSLTYAEGRVVENIVLLPDTIVDGREAFVYDSIGNVAEKSWYKGDGTLTRKQSWKYDAHGLVTETVVYHADGKVQVQYKFAYDSEGRLLEEFAINGKGKFQNHSLYLYNDKGFPSERSWLNKRGKICAAWKYEYEFDAQGNWTRQVRSTGGKPKVIVERRITYR